MEFHIQTEVWNISQSLLPYPMIKLYHNASGVITKLGSYTGCPQLCVYNKASSLYIFCLLLKCQTSVNEIDFMYMKTPVHVSDSSVLFHFLHGIIGSSYIFSALLFSAPSFLQTHKIHNF